MDIKYFEYVIEIVGYGPVNRAAQNPQMLQPNLGVCIRNLEQELGSPIFRRQHSGIRLADEGELFLKFARKIVTELETIHNIPSTFNHKDNLSISYTYLSDFMNHSLKFKKKRLPTTCEDSFKGTDLTQTIRDVMGQRYRMSLFYYFDMVSDIYHASVKRHDPKLIPIARNRPLIFLTSRKDPLSCKKGIPLDSITDYKFIMYESFKFDKWLKILNFKSDNNVLYVFDRGGLAGAIRQNRYVIVMMRRFTDTYSEDCTEIFIVDASFGMDVYCLYRASYTMNSREKQFIWELKELFADHPVDRPI